MLSGDEIHALKLISNGVSGSYRRASYDLTIGHIIDSNGESHDSYSMEPQGIVNVVSAEQMGLPDDVSGFAMVKTSLCNEGLLALNIGVIDPSWHGPLSTPLLNFGKRKRLLQKGDKFLRVAFHKLDTAPQNTQAQFQAQQIAKANDEYVRDVRKRAVEDFSNEFLDVSLLTKNLVDKQLDKAKGIAYRWLVVVTVLITVLTLVVPILISWSNIWHVKDWVRPSDGADVRMLKGALDERDGRIASDLERINARLEQDALAMRATNEALLKELDSMKARLESVERRERAAAARRGKQ